MTSNSEMISIMLLPVVIPLLVYGTIYVAMYGKYLSPVATAFAFFVPAVLGVGFSFLFSEIICNRAANGDLKDTNAYELAIGPTVISAAAMVVSFILISKFTDGFFVSEKLVTEVVATPKSQNNSSFYSNTIADDEMAWDGISTRGDSSLGGESMVSIDSRLSKLEGKKPKKAPKKPKTSKEIIVISEQVINSTVKFGFAQFVMFTLVTVYYGNVGAFSRVMSTCAPKSTTDIPEIPLQSGGAPTS